MDLISIIVPVRNCVEFLEDCISSIRNQTYKTIEVILIDDGSTDGSFELADQMSREDERILVIKGPQKGLGAARQAGLDLARGRFVVFVDSDDYLWGMDCLGTLHQAIESKADSTGKGADIAAGNYVREMFCSDGPGSEIVPAIRHGWNDTTHVESGNFRFEAFFSKGHLAYVWGKMYRTSFLRNHGIEFSGLSYAEDKLFNFMCYGHANSYVFIEEDVYCYRQNPQSASGVYRKDFKDNWLGLAGLWNDGIRMNGWTSRLEDLSAFILIFAVFFDGKMKYEQERGWTRLVSLIGEYKRDPLVAYYIKKMVRGSYVSEIDDLFWRWGLWLFALCLYVGPAWLTAAGVKALVDWKVDKRLSSTGKREKRKA